MTNLRPADSVPQFRPELVNSVAKYLQQYPQDIVDTKHLIKRFQLTADKFLHVLRTQEKAEEIALLPPHLVPPCGLTEYTRLWPIYCAIPRTLSMPSASSSGCARLPTSSSTPCGASTVTVTVSKGQGHAEG
jgi:hypothetical protein